MTLNDFKAALKSGAVSGWYIFAGEEDYLKRYYRSELVKAVAPDDAFATFNHTVFDGDAMNVLKPGGALFFEIGEGQGDALREMFGAYGFTDVVVEKDYAGHDRYASGRLCQI